MLDWTKSHKLPVWHGQFYINMEYITDFEMTEWLCQKIRKITVNVRLIYKFVTFFFLKKYLYMYYIWIKSPQSKQSFVLNIFLHPNESLFRWASIPSEPSYSIMSFCFIGLSWRYHSYSNCILYCNNILNLVKFTFKGITD